MKCPDCGGFLVEVSLGGIDQSFRCFTCGGVFLHGKTANGLPESALNNWNSIAVDPELLKMGENTCPRDNSKLETYAGEGVPEDIIVRRCNQCKWWWFPTDTLFRFKPAQAARQRHMKAMGMAATLAAIALPLMVLTVIVGATFTRQQVNISAGAGVTNFAATYLGNGEEVVSFTSGSDIDTIVIRKSNGAWTDLPVAKKGNNYSVEISQLDEGESYELVIAGKIFKFQTKL